MRNHHNQRDCIYLIANNEKLRPRIFSSIPKGSICIHFNLAIHLNKLSRGRNWLVMNCCDSKYGGFWGYCRNMKRKHLFEEILFCVPPDRLTKNPWQTLMDSFVNFGLIQSVKYPHNGAYASVGYSTINHFRKDHTIVLVGFSFSGWNGHDWDYERAQVRDWGEIQQLK